MATKDTLRIALAAACMFATGHAALTRRPAPSFPDLARYKGSVVLLNFWATTCGGCRLEIPWFMEFERKYKTSGLTVLGVSLDEDGWKSVKPYVKQQKLNYPVVIGNDALAARYRVDALPMTFLIDRAGNIAAQYSGLVDRERCESEIRTLLREFGHAGKHAAKLTGAIGPAFTAPTAHTLAAAALSPFVR